MSTAIEDIYNFQNAESILNIEKSLGEKLLGRELQGVVCENFISPAEIVAILNGFRNLNERVLIKINEGFISYPISFAQMTQGLLSNNISEKNVHQDANNFRLSFPDTFGVDVETKLKILFEKVFSGRKVSVPIDRNAYGSFFPFNFRELLPEFGELKLHCENLFFDEFPYFFELMSHSVVKKNEFSFFIVLQKPDAGGELCLIDELWNGDSRAGFTEVGDTNNFVMEIENKCLRKQLVNPPVGSLVFFSGGDIWHRVNIVQGEKSRITLGGFISSGVDETKMYMWA